MSTRCHVILEKKDCETEFVYHHFDGYPEGVGEELVGLLKKYNKQHWEPVAIANWLEKQDDLYEPDDGIHGDEEYVYVIDCDKHTLQCFEYCNGIGAECKINGNVFDGTNSVDAGDDETNEDPIFDTIDFDTYWESYMKIVSAMIASNEYDLDDIPAKAKAMVSSCFNELRTSLL